MAFAPTARDVGKNRQDRNLIIVDPEKVRLVPEERAGEEQREQRRGTRA